ncbi:MAG: GNAT family N-acetyltransferase [Gemmatimonadales bacterium]|nr:GNAT family N-acetyltransferase [Gemmatimonadales bacterium]
MTARDLERFRSLHEHGHLCTIAWRGDRPIGYAWVALRMEPTVTQCPLPLPAHAAYLWDLYVTPAERSSGIGSALASARLRIAREHGREEGWRMIDESNHASNRTLAKSGGGTRVVGIMRFTKLFSRMRGQFQPAAGGAGATA